jgi:hypothetical protein
MTLLAVGKAVAMVPCTPLKVAYLVGYYGYQYAVASKASAPAKIEEAAEEALARSLDVDGWQLVGGATEGEVIGLSERILRAADKVFVPCLEQTVVHSEEQLMSTEAEMPTQRRAVFCVFSNMLKSMYGSNAAQTVAEELSGTYIDASDEGELNKQVLQIAAVFEHFQAPLEFFTQTPENPDECLQEVQVGLQEGHIEFFAREKDGSLTFAIKGDVVNLTTNQGTLIGSYHSSRQVTVGYPVNGSVECKMTTLYERVIRPLE